MKETSTKKSKENTLFYTFYRLKSGPHKGKLILGKPDTVPIADLLEGDFECSKGARVKCVGGPYQYDDKKGILIYTRDGKPATKPKCVAYKKCRSLSRKNFAA